MNRILTLSLIFLLSISGVALAKTTVAIMPFEGTEIRDWYLDRDQMIRGITESLTDQLAVMDGVSVVERSRLEQIIKEQNFGHSGRVDTFSAAEIGRLLGADLLILGTVNGLELKDSSGIQFGALSAKGTSAKVELSMRVVDVETGVILGSMQGSGSKVGASFGVQNLFGVSFYSDAFKNSVLGKAIDEAILDLMTKFSQDFSNLTQAPEELTGNILAVIVDKYVLNLGSIHNVARGDRFEVFQVVRVAGLSKPVEIPVGNLRVISVDEEASVAESDDGVFEEGYVVRKK